MSVFVKKPVGQLLAECEGVGEKGGLKRTLTATSLVALGIGAIIGAGIFTLTGVAASTHAGPALVYSFILAAIGCTFAGFCYSEFSTMIPIAGSAYTYAYATMGELLAWIIGWALILEYAVGAATVAVSWSATIASILADFGVHIPQAFLASPFDIVPGTVNVVAVFIVAAISTILVIGVQESARFNAVIVFIKVAVVVLFIVVGYFYIDKSNYTPFVPPNTTGKFGAFGWSGVLAAAGQIFFAYIGFDAVSTAAQEAKNPKRDMPIGIIGSLAVCTVLYILYSLVLTGVVNYKDLNVAAPLAVAVDRMNGVPWIGKLMKLGSLLGLTSVILVMLLGQSRVFFSMSKDGLLPKWASAIHPKFRTPWISTIVVGVIVAIMPAFLNIDILSDLVNIGTLLAFTIVCAGVWVLRVRQPDLHRPFKTPLVPLVPILGIVTAVFVMSRLPLITWEVMIGWLLVGLVIYFTYSRNHSKVQKLPVGTK